MCGLGLRIAGLDQSAFVGAVEVASADVEAFAVGEVEVHIHVVDGESFGDGDLAFGDDELDVGAFFVVCDAYVGPQRSRRHGG